jgi:hypothetical protein
MIHALGLRFCGGDVRRFGVVVVVVGVGTVVGTVMSIGVGAVDILLFYIQTL